MKNIRLQKFGIKNGKNKNPIQYENIKREKYIYESHSFGDRRKNI